MSPADSETGGGGTATPVEWSDLCHEYDRMIDRLASANRRLYAVTWFCFCWAVIWMGVALWALTK